MALLLGLDIGTSSIKASLLDSQTSREIGSATAPRTEMAIKSVRAGFAEQDPNQWWENAKAALSSLAQSTKRDLKDVKAVGITYQMHGLVVTDATGKPIRDSIIWCDSRAVPYGQKAYQTLGEEFCKTHLLNSPGNFTAAKLRWVMEHEPQSLKSAAKFMLPGDYIAYRMTGEPNTTPSGLSEMILWDFVRHAPSTEILEVFEIPEKLMPKIVPTFGEQGRIGSGAASELGLSPGTPVTFRAGDQPNNAFSLNVLAPGEVAATAGTSGVIYGVSDTARCDDTFRVNSFLHVTNTETTQRLGVLLCINGVGILNSWLKREMMDSGITYDQMNALAEKTPLGSDGLSILPYGNGAERTLNNQDIGASVHGLRLTQHTRSHMLRAAQEGIAFSLNYGFEIMRGVGVEAATIRAGNANMFLSPLFSKTFASITGATLQILDTDGAQGAARGAGVGAGIFTDFREAFAGLNVVKTIEPDTSAASAYQDAYGRWKRALSKSLA